MRVYDDAVADDTNGVGMDDADGQKVQGKRFAFVDNSVTGVGTALKTDNDVGFAGEAMDNGSLAFVAPLCPDDDQDGHKTFPLVSHEHGCGFLDDGVLAVL
jgi:hypothetical protein